MKKDYKRPMIVTIEVIVDSHLLEGSNTATNAGVNVSVDDWESDED